MPQSNITSIFTKDTLNSLFPPARSNDFFEALFGDASEGAYDISLHFNGNSTPNSLHFELHLTQRPGHCLACNLTYGLPEVFSRHPIINLAGVAQEICSLAGISAENMQWKLGATQSGSSQKHTIPFTISYS